MGGIFVHGYPDKTFRPEGGNSDFCIFGCCELVFLHSYVRRISDPRKLGRLTEVMSEEYQIKNDDKTIKNVINTYKIEKLDSRKMELIEKQQMPGLSKEEEKNIIEEINKIIIAKKLIK